MRQRGFAIILVLATLVLLAMLSITYIKLALIDRNIARNYMDNKRAKLIAQSGVEYAIARLDQTAQDTSFFFSDSWQNLTKGTISINGKNENYTESAGSTYGENRDIFKVQVKDSNSMLNINNGLENARVRANLARIINTLANYLNSSKGKSLPANIGEVITNRTEKYTQKRELLTVLAQAYGSSLAEQYYEDLKDYLTTYSWQDPNVANPVPLSSVVLSAYPVKYNEYIGVYRYGRGKDSSGNIISTIGGVDYSQLRFADESSTFAAPNQLQHAIYGLDELNPQWIEIVSRSPVNINTAPREVLVALLKDLKGFFISDRRRNCPPYEDAYTFERAAEPLFSPTPNSIYTFNYSPASPLGDEYGFLYSTREIDLAIAGSIADEIISRRVVVPFKTWRQFNAFCDSFVGDGELLNDTRSIFYEYAYNFMTASYDLPVSSEVARKQASQAMADCLKANFNPNLHLNELNPDANIKTLVDKTDLIVNSTEFCFTPMGDFQITSEGMILKEDKIIAKHKIEALVKIFDSVRYTSEKQFVGGIADLAAYTNNGYLLEIGPEPAHVQSQAASENEWSGYIALATVNVSDSLPWTTFRSHFSKNFNADYHADGETYKPNKTDYNLADKTESNKGPYTYNLLDYRLARSFRKEIEVNTSRAPADLRIDGAYVERHAGLAYKIGPYTMSGSSTLVLVNPGMISYWIKPSFYPETTGKPRTFFSISQPVLVGNDYWPKIFANFFLPSHWPDSKLAEENLPLLGGLSTGRAFRPTSLLFGYHTFWAGDSVTLWDTFGGIGYSTPVLNHLSHPSTICGTRPNYLKSGQWIHVICAWNLPPPIPANYTGGTVYTPPAGAENSCQIWINGVKHVNSSLLYAHTGSATLKTQTLYYVRHFRVGESILATIAAGEDRRNWTCDSTVDEFYIFSGSDPSSVKNNTYARSRYCTFYGIFVYETSYISTILNLSKRELPASTTIQNPLNFGQIGSASMSYAKIIGLSWTYYGESTDASGNAKIRDYKTFEAVPPNDLDVRLKVSILRNYNPSTETSQANYGPFDQDGYRSAAIEIDPLAQYRYKVTFKIQGATTDTVLLYSPIFDDITIYYASGVKFISYSDIN